jgi:hypothetical protein
VTPAPVVIIGAPRSGTNILRDVLARHPECDTWPCDEINYVWRHGNRGMPTDEFTAAHAGPGVRRFIRKAFDRQQSRQGGGVVIEKTCANSLRVPFVDAVLPEARYVFIVRDGRDVVASAMKRWRASFDPRYVLRKARFVPASDIPYYGVRFVRDRLFRRLSGEQRAASWGPRFAGMEQAIAEGGLAGVCAAQWAACVTRSLDAFAGISPSRVHRIEYEAFVQDPAATMTAVGDFLEIGSADWSALSHDVQTSSVGRGSVELSADEQRAAERYLKPVLERLGRDEATA